MYRFEMKHVECGPPTLTWARTEVDLDLCFIRNCRSNCCDDIYMYFCSSNKCHFLNRIAQKFDHSSISQWGMKLACMFEYIPSRVKSSWDKWLWFSDKNSQTYKSPQRGHLQIYFTDCMTDIYFTATGERWGNGFWFNIGWWTL